MARGRDLMRFYCSDDVTGAIVQAVVEWKTLDSIYRSILRYYRSRKLPLNENRTSDQSGKRVNPVIGVFLNCYQNWKRKKRI